MRSAIEMDKYNTITLHHIALHCIDSVWAVKCSRNLVSQMIVHFDCLFFLFWVCVSCVVGSVLDSMATAVENASVVIMCMSSSYQKSENCKKG